MFYILFFTFYQLNSVDVVMGRYVLDTLRFPLEIWSEMITMASVNASASVPYLKTMLGLHAAQLPYSETIISMADFTCNTADQATADNTNDLINLSEFIIIYMGFAMFANLLLASLRMAYYRDMASDALAIKARFLVLISVCSFGARFCLVLFFSNRILCSYLCSMKCERQ